MPNPSAQKFNPVRIETPPPLPIYPPSRDTLVPTTRLTTERLNSILARIPSDFLSSSEIDLTAFVLHRRQDAIAFTDNERGTLKQEYFPDYEIPVIEHTPWIRPPIRVPKAIESDVRSLIRTHCATGRYEDSCASYRSRVFPVLKKSGALRLVHDLQDLNAVTIRDSALPPLMRPTARWYRIRP
ncbi:hypothetical protein EUX98_g9433 [Antrodiella citrinella]|uniref:Integrase zinc-binding domain-containing protein n=1 Tax=Antrodiella citrinella TaxID=2447956 RepID=A0A4S4LU90_9APHY|nr:hypothetical protein EUX98_g9433 [Antrodiella citrinella]